MQPRSQAQAIAAPNFATGLAQGLAQQNAQTRSSPANQTNTPLTLLACLTDGIGLEASLIDDLVARVEAISFRLMGEAPPGSDADRAAQAGHGDSHGGHSGEIQEIGVRLHEIRARFEAILNRIENVI